MNLFRNIPFCVQVFFVNKDKHGKKWLAENSIADGHQIRSSIVDLWEYMDYDTNTPPPPPPLYPGALQFSPGSVQKWPILELKLCFLLLENLI